MATASEICNFNIKSSTLFEVHWTYHKIKLMLASRSTFFFFFLFQENTPCIEYKSLFYTFHFFFLEDSRVVRHSEHASMFFFSSTEQSSFTLPGNVCKQPFCKKAIVAKLPNRPTQDFIWTSWNIVYALKVSNIVYKWANYICQAFVGNWQAFATT